LDGLTPTTVDKEFWHDRWARGEIGFHQSEYNPHLLTHFERLGLNPGAHVFVPLCGKSLDMVWLLRQGCRVTGVEFSRLAVESFFAETGRGFSTETVRDAVRYRSGDLDIWCGDFFALDPAVIHSLHAVYDRAALVALPESMRQRYAERLLALAPANAPILLLGIDYRQEQMNGPPFAVSIEEVRELFGQARRVELLFSEDRLAHEPRYLAKGLEQLTEYVLFLQPIRRYSE
jgi:thiopurine S-methyltransferase